jgi:hypothetical protein
MRLLQYTHDGEFCVTDAIVDEDTAPPYAILSHTWGTEEEEEVTFDDIASGVGKSKPGYKKIQFCWEQARQDGFQYLWIDTCCIDKKNKAELSHSIQSMFRWYQTAAKCYVYLSDVTTRKRKASNLVNGSSWEDAFRSSRWFNRGWTLQELLAPSSVEFFSREGERLGDKTSLKEQIHRITNIPLAVLEGTPLSQFSVNERLRWKEHRETKREEDGAYSLLGIFNIDLAPIYGEGAAGAFKRLMDEIEKQERCTQDLRSTDPRDDKKRIEDTKGGLLKDSYRWILDNSSYQQWLNDSQSRLLWIKGDPGKGKTMLLCGVIDELQKSMPRTALVSYFFCQATDSRINSAASVLRGLLYMLIRQQPVLIWHVRKKHNHAGKAMFEDANAWVALTETFTDLLHDPGFKSTYLVIDALDECITDLPKLLDFIGKHLSDSSRVKWIISSRNSPDIEDRLERASYKTNLSLELNAKAISTAVGIYIQKKVERLAQDKNYDVRTKDAVLEYLASNANDTFLWVALVCQNLEGTTKRHVLKKLATLPPGLDFLYKQMMHQMNKSDDAEVCKRVLASATILYRPVNIHELAALVDQLEDFENDPDSVREIISLCGSFLTVREDTVYFVHQSAKDFLLAKAHDEVFPHGSEEVHQSLFLRSLGILSRTLKRDIYDLKEPGYAIENVQAPDPDPLGVARYPCIYWVDHLCDSNPESSVNNATGLQFDGAVDLFLREKYLYWLEGLSLCKNMPKGVVSMAKLQSLVQVCVAQAMYFHISHDLDTNIN